PIVEANTVRLYARLMALSEDPTTSESQKKLWTFAEQLLPEESEERDGKNPYPYGRLNQSLMELGSLVCTPRAPRCGDCPVAHVCKTNQLGGNAVSRIPVVKAKPTVQPVREAALLIYRPMEPKLDSEISTTPRDRNVFLVRRRTSRERWSGLWDFPRFPVGELCDRPLFDYLRSQFTSVTKEDSEWCETSFTFSSRTGEIEPIMNLADRLVFDTLEPMKILRHSVTRYSITLEVYLARISSRVVLSNPTLRLPRMKGKRPAQRTLFSGDDGDNRFESAKWPNLPSHLARVLSPEPGTASVPLLSSIPTNSPGTTFPMGTEWSWMTLEQLEQAPMHTTARKMTTLAVVLERMPLPPS
ncbi:MAG: hypothetical protein PHE53_03575, partial [Thermoguttaceae bacterium]|nr:hypothetical protein [Thermoguttaceae bacterium]